MEQDRYTLAYRAAEARQVMNCIKAGQSGCLVGLRGAGKSSFLRFLLRQDVWQHYLEEDYPDFSFVLIDFLALAKQAEWAVCELILNRLLGQLRNLSVERELVEEITSLRREVRQTRDPFTAQWAVERSADLLCQRPAQRIVLLFDQFDTVFRSLDSSLFRCLRAVYDAHEGQISYIVAVTSELARLRDDLAEVDHFHRLVSRNVCYIGPLNNVNAQHWAHHLAARRSVELSQEDVTCVIKLSGGHAGLIKAILSLLWTAHQEHDLAELTPFLKDEPAVQAECRKMWDCLPETEQIALCGLKSGAQADPRVLRRLKLKGLVRESESTPSLFSPLFAHFVHRQAPPLLAGTVISRSPPIAQIGERPIDGLSELEFEALCYLYEHRGEVCTKDDLIENVYQQQYDRTAGGMDDARLQTLIARLREKIEPDRSRPRYILTVRGEGYKFVEPGGE